VCPVEAREAPWTDPPSPQAKNTTQWTWDDGGYTSDDRLHARREADGVATWVGRRARANSNLYHALGDEISKDRSSVSVFHLHYPFGFYHGPLESCSRLGPSLLKSNRFHVCTRMCCKRAKLRLMTLVTSLKELLLTWLGRSAQWCYWTTG
jgi:hypothetical protein